MWAVRRPWHSSNQTAPGHSLVTSSSPLRPLRRYRSELVYDSFVCFVLFFRITLVVVIVVVIAVLVIVVVIVVCTP